MLRALPRPRFTSRGRAALGGLPPRRSAGHGRIALGALAAALVLAACWCAGAQAAPSLGPFTAASLPAGADATAVSCPSEALCVAVSHEGAVLDTLDPATAAPAAPSWSATPVDPGGMLTGVSCASGGPCVAVGAHGDAFVSANAAAGSWSPTPIAEAGTLTGVSCPSSSLCVAVEEGGEVWTSTSPASGHWHAAGFGSGRHWTAVSCSSTSQCAAVDAAGEVFTSTAPTGGAGAWHGQRLDVAEPLGVSCASTTLCVIVDSEGRALASADPAAEAPSWTFSWIDPGTKLTAVSCATTGLCAAVDAAGRVLASDQAAAVGEWSVAKAIDGSSLTGVSCLAGGLCMAVDGAGHSLSARVGTPVATTLAPTETTSSGAQLAGAAEASGALLEACSFEYGTGAAGAPLSGSVPCTAAAGTIPVAGRAGVSAALGGLAPNTTYHYRLVLTSASGTSAGTEATFTTATSSQIAPVTPNPSISGTPAVGQHLSCHPNLPAGASAQLTYAWVRDQIPIPETDSSAYTVKGQDSGHHLQCQVTATDGGGSVTKLSGFVTIPAGGAPASAGETTVGSASFRDGQVSVPVACSSQATGGCEVTLRLTAVETLSGRHVVALAAHAVSSRPRRRGHTAGLRHTTVALVTARAHIGAGVRTTIAAVLGATARRLLAAHRRFTANLTVTGTVIGVIEAQLAQQQLTLTAPSGHVARHGKRRR